MAKRRMTRIDEELMASAEEYAELARCSTTQAINDLLAYILQPDHLGLRLGIVTATLDALGLIERLSDQLGKLEIHRAAA